MRMMYKISLLLSKLRFQKRNLLTLTRFCFTNAQKKDIFIENLRESFKHDESKQLIVPAFKKALLYPEQIAVKDSTGDYTYFELYMNSQKLSFQISNICGSASLSNVLYICGKNCLWIVMQWACWISGQVAIPVEQNASSSLLKEYIQNFKPKLIISSAEYEINVQNVAKSLNRAVLTVDHSFLQNTKNIVDTYAKQVITNDGYLLTESTLPNDFYINKNAMIIPKTPSQKSVMLTFRNIETQMKILTDSWKLNSMDSMLNILSLNRMHSAVNALLCVGGSVLFLEESNCHNVWSSILGVNNPSKQRINIFIASPVIFKRLIAEYDKIFARDSCMVEYILNHCKNKIRIMASVYEPLSDTLLHRWRTITGRNLLEFYGTTETGLVLGNKIAENSEDTISCLPGTFNSPLNGVIARLITHNGTEINGYYDQVNASCNPNFLLNVNEMEDSPAGHKIVGELQLAGENVFKEYFQQDNQHLFSECFFKTQDIFRHHNCGLSFLGKIDDIVTVGGYKIYSLEIKKALYTYSNIKEVTILGISNKVWGQCLGVICVLYHDDFNLDALKSSLSQLLPTYKRPTIFKVIK